jgi:hypothetical protein
VWSAYGRLVASRRTLVVLLAAWTVGWFAVMAVPGGYAWHFFTIGEGILSDLDDPRLGLHVYADDPKLQIGPVAFLVTWLLRLLSPRSGMLTAQLFCAGAIVLVLAMVQRIAVLGQVASRLVVPLDRIDRRLLAAAFCVVPVWMYAAVFSLHLDDVLAMIFGVAALLCALDRRPWLTGLFVALAVDSKPWAVPFAAVILLLPGARSWLRSAVAAAIGVAAAWLPFFVADPNTTRALRFTIANTALSALRVLGVQDPRTPSWDRPAQMLIGLALAAIAVRRGRWAAALLVAMSVRLALDPGTNRYYTAGLVVGALVWDVCGSRLRWPAWSLTAFLLLHELRWLRAFDPLHGWLVLGFAAAATAVAVHPAENRPVLLPHYSPFDTEVLRL